MQLQPQQTLELVMRRAISLGRLVVEQVQNGVVLAQFSPGPGYRDVKAVFDQFEDAVNQQMFTIADEVGTAIAALGLCLRTADGYECVPVHDVQIMDGHDFSCRLSPLPAAASARENE